MKAGLGNCGEISGDDRGAQRLAVVNGANDIALISWNCCSFK